MRPPDQTGCAPPLYSNVVLVMMDIAPSIVCNSDDEFIISSHKDECDKLKTKNPKEKPSVHIF